MKKILVEFEVDQEELCALQTFGGLDVGWAVQHLSLAMAFFIQDTIRGLRGKLDMNESRVLLTSLRNIVPSADAPGKQVKDEVKLAVLLQDVAAIYSVDRSVLLSKVNALHPSELVAVELWAHSYWTLQKALNDPDLFDQYAGYLGGFNRGTECVGIKQ